MRSCRQRQARFYEQTGIAVRIRKALGVFCSRHYSPRTEKTYCQWAVRFIRFHKYRHPAEMGEKEINEFLTHLAVEQHVSASTQNRM